MEGLRGVWRRGRKEGERERVCGLRGEGKRGRKREEGREGVRLVVVDIFLFFCWLFVVFFYC